jgi:hypothetical protein
MMVARVQLFVTARVKTGSVFVAMLSLGPVQNFRYTSPYQGLGWRSQLFRGVEAEEEKRLSELCKVIPPLEVSEVSPKSINIIHRHDRNKKLR